MRRASDTWQHDDFGHPSRPRPAGQPLHIRQQAGLQALLEIAESAEAPIRRKSNLGVLSVGTLTGLALGAIVALHVSHRPDGAPLIELGWYGIAVTILIGAKLIMSLLARPAPDRPRTRSWVQHCKVAATITCYNEDPAALKQCLESILRSRRRPDVLTLIDDASTDRTCADLARSYTAAFRSAGIDYEVIVFAENQGKREGLAEGFWRAWDADVYLCIDSDTIVHKDAIGNALRPLADPRVQGVTGCVLAANRHRNLLTRLIDLRYTYAFLGERAAYSVLGSVLCACGSLALYRGWVVREYLDDFLSQTFLGRQCTYGDDRRLTYYCLREGKVLLAPDAFAWTLVPERMNHFIRQQLRWSKSFFRESISMLRTVGPNRVAWWLTLIELSTWGGFTTALLFSLFVRPALSGHFAALTYLFSVLILAYARSGHYFETEHPGLRWYGKFATLLLAPLYGLIHMTILLPLRLVALATLRDNGWGTREAVEVTK
jgi:hyaluronan synthase